MSFSNYKETPVSKVLQIFSCTVSLELYEYIMFPVWLPKLSEQICRIDHLLVVIIVCLIFFGGGFVACILKMFRNCSLLFKI